MSSGSPANDVMALLKLTALDSGDLEIISAHLQDAIVRTGDIRHLRNQQRFVLAANRFVWENAAARASGPYERRRTGLRFERVRSVKAHRVRQDDPEAVMSLLAIRFEPGDEPSGDIVITLSGGGSLRLTVDYIEGQVEDLGPSWETPNLPVHEDESR